MHEASCELCGAPGSAVVWQDSLCRVVQVSDPDYPAYCRVIWNAHVAEMTDLSASERRHCMSVVFAVEAALRGLAQADKMNLASLGNRVPHLHWHVVARLTGDRHFPEAIWGTAQRETGRRAAPIQAAALHRAIVEALAEEHAG